MKSPEGSAEYDLPVTQRGVMRLTTRLRERYLLPEQADGDCVAQAVGSHLNVWIPSDRDTIRLEIDLEGWNATRPYTQSIHRWGITISRFPGVVIDSDGEERSVSVSVSVENDVEVPQ